MGKRISKRVITSNPTGQLIGRLNNGVQTVSSSSIEDLNDVNIIPPVNIGDLLAYNGNQWQNMTLEDTLQDKVVILDGGNAVDI